MRKYPTRDKGRAIKGTMDEKLWYGAAIPQRYWADKCDIQPIQLEYYKSDGTLKVVSVDTQLLWMHKILQPEVLSQPYLIILGSIPSDEKAMMVASRAAKAAIRAGMKAHAFNIVGKDYPDDKDDVVVMYNLSESACPIDRLLRVKDSLVRNEDKCSILVVEGNPGTFASQLLKTRQPNAILAFSGPLVVQRSL